MRLRCPAPSYRAWAPDELLEDAPLEAVAPPETKRSTPSMDVPSMVHRSFRRSIYCDSIQSHMNRVGTEIRMRLPSTPTSVIGFNQLLYAASPYSALSRPLILAHWAASLSSIRIVTPTVCRRQRRATNLSNHRPALQPDHNRLRRNAGIQSILPVSDIPR